MKALLSCAALGIALLSTVEASADGHASGFGDKGQLIISADRLVPLFSYTHQSVDTTNGNPNAPVTTTDSQNATGISLLFGRDLSDDELRNFPVNVHSIPRVAFDITVIPKLTLGIGLAFGFGLGGSTSHETVSNNTTVVTTKTDAPSYTAIGIAPRVGYIIPIGEHLAFWPRGGFAFYSVSASIDQTTNNGTIVTSKATDTYLSLDLDPQLAIIPVEHFYFSVGPLLNIPLTGSRSVSTTTGAATVDRSNDASVLHFGITASIGGWVDVF